jgi:hypothetical protein
LAIALEVDAKPPAILIIPAKELMAYALCQDVLSCAIIAAVIIAPALEEP